MNDRYRMYGLVPYNLSPIQQGIQYGHAVQEFNNRAMEGVLELPHEAFKEWRKECKTFIILNGGTTNNNPDKLGTLNVSMNALIDELNTFIAPFYEPDLGDQLTAVVFLVDDRVYNKKKYPDYAGPSVSYGMPAASSPMEPHYSEWKSQFGSDADEVIKMREFLSQFRLA